jgi:hypothetical protein
MKPTDNVNAVLITIFFTMILLGLPVQAHATWMEDGMHPGAMLNPNQGQVIHHEVHLNITPPLRVETQNRDQPTVNHHQTAERHEPKTPGYFRRDTNYYGLAQMGIPYADVDTGFVVPEGFENIVVDGQTYYYNDGIFYQQVGNQLTAVPPVLGAVVDYIPDDYQIVMADGAHYLVTGGVYYQRVDQGFEVVQPPVSDQG